MTIRDAAPDDAAAIAGIYNHYIEHTVVTFEEQPVSPEEMARRVDEVRAASLPWCVADADGDVVGYAYARPWNQRSAYRFAVETSIYVAAGLERRGIGTALYGALFS